MRGLLATLAKLPTLEDDIPDVDLWLLPLDSHAEQCKLRIILRIFINESLQAILSRTAESLLYELLQGFPIVTLTGPRQSGKTTLARKVMWQPNSVLPTRRTKTPKIGSYHQAFGSIPRKMKVFLRRPHGPSTTTSLTDTARQT